MRYGRLIDVKPGSSDRLTSDEREAISAEYLAIARDERVLGGAQLQPVEMATRVRVRDGQPVTTDGPFAETKEVFKGYYVLEPGDLDAALGVAPRISAARMGGSVEVCALVEPPA